jgi:hypothetical protein
VVYSFKIFKIASSAVFLFPSGAFNFIFFSDARTLKKIRAKEEEWGMRGRSKEEHREERELEKRRKEKRGGEGGCYLWLGGTIFEEGEYHPGGARVLNIKGKSVFYFFP